MFNIYIAMRARDVLNFSIINDKEILIVPYDRNFLNQTRTNVFVKNIPPNFTNKKLWEIFKNYGEIFSCRLPVNFKGIPRGYGFVQFRELAGAEAAVREMNQKVIEGVKISVMPYKLKETKDRPEKRYTNIYVKNLPPDIITNEALADLFKDYGKIASVGIYHTSYREK